eukprot:1158556-Pelagomonas_calceolata.AAC.7
MPCRCAWVCAVPVEPGMGSACGAARKGAKGAEGCGNPTAGGVASADGGDSTPSLCRRTAYRWGEKRPAASKDSSSAASLGMGAEAGSCEKATVEER